MISEIRAVASSKRTRLVSAIVLVALGLFCVFDSGHVADLTFYSAINERAVDLIDETLMRDQVTFLVITAIKTSLAVIEGSTVGVGFQLQVGDIVQPAYDYVDFFWRAFLYAFLVMGFYKLLLETELLLLGIGLVGIGLMLLGLALGRPIPQLELRLWGKRCVLLGILMAYIAPLSLLLTHVLSERYTKEIRDKHYETIQAFDNELDAAATEFLEFRTQISLLQPGRSLDELKTSMLRVANRVGETFRLSLLAFLYYVLVIMFELLFFPLLSALILYKFTQLALDRLLLNPAPRPVPPGPLPAAG